MSSAILTLPNAAAGGLPGALAFATQDSDAYGRSFQDPWRAGIAPRLGAGYSLNSKTLLRGSWGFYYSGTGNPTSILNPGYTSTPAFSSADNITPAFNLHASRSRSRSTGRRFWIRRFRTGRQCPMRPRTPIASRAWPASTLPSRVSSSRG